jgi:hypothetical protein
VKNKNSTGLRTTTSCIIFTSNPGFNDVFGAAHSRGYMDCRWRAILRAGTAFHAAVQIMNPGYESGLFGFEVKKPLEGTRFRTCRNPRRRFRQASRSSHRQDI